MSKILSIIIPSYNAERFLDTCITSFLCEEVLEALDLIIVNDGSTDGTQAIAEKYCRAYPGSVRLINQENKGHGGALNTGSQAAVGKYLKAVDADDWAETQNLPEFIKLLDGCDSDVVLTHHYTINITNGEVKKWKAYPKAYGKAYRLDEIMAEWKNFDRSMTFHGIAYRTDFYHAHAVSLSEHVFYEDHEYAAIPCCYAGTVTPLDLFIYDYRIGDVQQSVSDENQLKRISHIEAVLQRLQKEYETLHLEPKCAGRDYYCRKTRGVLLSYMTTVLLAEKDKKHGRKLAEQMIQEIGSTMPQVYDMAKRQYQIFCLMNRCHVSKTLWQKILDSKIYRVMMRKKD